MKAFVLGAVSFYAKQHYLPGLFTARPFSLFVVICINGLDCGTQLLESVRKMAQTVHSLRSLDLETPSVTGC